LVTAVQQLNRTTTRNKLFAWLPTLLWLAMIACFSTDVFSAKHTGSLTWSILHWLRPTITIEQFNLIHFFIRKGAHFSAYGFLSFLSYRSWRVTLPSLTPWTFRWSGLALALTLLAASSDEFHQSFVPSRTSSPLDVVLDMTGALFVQILIASFTDFAKVRRKTVQP
jgi:VanZ family protein